MGKRETPFGMNTLLHGDAVRRVEHEGQTWFVAADVVTVLDPSGDASERWPALKAREPQLARAARSVALPGEDGAAIAVDCFDLAGLFRVVQSLDTPRAEKVKAWLARTAVERIAEAENPELAVLRTRKLYESKGYSRRWVDKRLRGVSARHELTGEWYKRGAKESDQFRALTNTIVEGGFGMDVETYRRHKGLFKTGENLRDHMSDLELALTALGETAAVELHRDRDSRDFDALLTDARDAGEIVARTRSEIEERLGHEIVEAGNDRGWWAGRRRVAAQPGRGTQDRVDAPEAPENNAAPEQAESQDPGSRGRRGAKGA